MPGMCCLTNSHVKLHGCSSYYNYSVEQPNSSHSLCVCLLHCITCTFFVTTSVMNEWLSHCPPYMSCDQVVKYWPQRNSEGLLVWKYLLRRDDPVSMCGMDMITLSLFFCCLPWLLIVCIIHHNLVTCPLVGRGKEIYQETWHNNAGNVLCPPYIMFCCYYSAPAYASCASNWSVHVSFWVFCWYWLFR